MKVIKEGLTIKQAVELADKMALETGTIHSVRISNRLPTTFFVVEGMVGNERTRYVARPETLRFRRPDKGLPPLFGFPWERKE